MKESKPVAIGDVVSAILNNLGIEKRNPQARILKIWNEAVGKDIASHTRPAEIKKGLLIVHVDSSPWMSELNRHYKNTIIGKLRDLTGEEGVKDIKFRIGEVK